MKTSKYHIGFSSQENEIELNKLPIRGTMPPWLNGDLIRTAPSKFEVGTRSYSHWFDGLAMLHKFSFRNGQVGYTCKFLKSSAYRDAMEKNRIVYGEFGTDPCLDLFRKVASFFTGRDTTDNGCVNIVPYRQQLTAVTETPKPVAFRKDNLDTTGLVTFKKDSVNGQITIVHPHYDNAGTLFSYETRFGYRSAYQIYSLAASDVRKKKIATIITDKPSYMHSIGMTEKFIILTEFPIVVNPLELRFSNKPFIECYHWRPERGTRIHLVEKESGAIRSFETDPFFAFHHVNAFERNDEVVFDLVGYEDAAVISQLYLSHLRSEQLSLLVSGQLWRFRISLHSKTVSRQVLSPAPLELPRINYLKINTCSYRYVFGTGITVPGNFLDNITKINVDDGQVKTWFEEHCYPGEPVFVESPHPEREDDGVLLSVVLDGKTQTSYLLILNARDLQEIARAQVPQHITFGFHGQYVPEGGSLPRS